MTIRRQFGHKPATKPRGVRECGREDVLQQARTAHPWRKTEVHEARAVAALASEEHEIRAERQGESSADGVSLGSGNDRHRNVEDALG